MGTEGRHVEGGTGRKGTRRSSGRSGTARGREEWQRAENFTRMDRSGGCGEDHVVQKSWEMARMHSQRGAGRDGRQRETERDRERQRETERDRE